MKEGTPKRLGRFGAAFTALTLAACGTSAPQPTGEVLGANTDNSIVEMGWPIDRTVAERLNAGAHNFNAGVGADMTKPPLNQLIRNELDISNLTVISCVSNPNASMPFNTVASRSGTIISEGGTFKQIQIKDDLGFIETYTHVGDMKYKTNERVEQGTTVAGTLECTPNDTGLHVDFSVTDPKGAGVDMERVVFVDGLGGKTKNTEASTNYDGGMVMPDGYLITADARVCQTQEDCGGVINIIPALGGVAVETQKPTETATTEELLDQYLNVEGKDKYTQIAAKALRFWIETYTSKKDKTDITENENFPKFLQVDTSIDDWADVIPSILSTNFSTDWSPEAQKVFDAHYVKTGTDAREGEVQIKNLRVGIAAIENFSEVDKANGMELLEVVHIKYLSRWKTRDEQTGSLGDWTEWVTSHVDGNPEGEAIFDFRVKSGKTEMYCFTCDIGEGFMGIWATNYYDNPQKEVPWLGE